MTHEQSLGTAPVQRHLVHACELEGCELLAEMRRLLDALRERNQELEVSFAELESRR